MLVGIVVVAAVGPTTTARHRTGDKTTTPMRMRMARLIPKPAAAAGTTIRTRSPTRSSTPKRVESARRGGHRLVQSIVEMVTAMWEETRMPAGTALDETRGYIWMKEAWMSKPRTGSRPPGETECTDQPTKT
jgi:hypothetical protein